MILVTGGFGFIGSHVTRALTQMGEACVVTHRKPRKPPSFISPDVQSVGVDLGDLDALAAVGEGREITAIVHLAAPPLGLGNVIDDLRDNMNNLFNVMSVAAALSVRRVVVASTIGVYAGAEIRNPMPEDTLLPLRGLAPVDTFKRSAEILATQIASRSGFEIANARISAVWGPLGRPSSPFFALPAMAHAAVAGSPIDLANPDHGPARHADDGIDALYAADCGHALALLATTPGLRHTVYNVGSGRLTTANDAAQAVREVVPDAQIRLADGRSPGAVDVCLDITRLTEDTAFAPAFDLRSGVADYVAWLRAGNPR